MVVMARKPSTLSPSARSADWAIERATALDAGDPLRAFRDRFVNTDESIVYLDGNSLGRLPKATAERLASVISDEWGGELVLGWEHWIDDAQRVGDMIG